MTDEQPKILVIYYSFEGNCRELGRIMAEAAGADVAEIVPRREIPRNFAGKYFHGGKGSFLKETVEIEPVAADARDYDLTIIGTPVWAWNMPPATRAFLAGQDWRGAKTALYVMHRGGKGFALSSMRKLIENGGGLVAEAIDFTDLRSRHADATRNRAREWAAGLARSAASS